VGIPRSIFKLKQGKHLSYKNSAPKGRAASQVMGKKKVHNIVGVRLWKKCFKRL